MKEIKQIKGVINGDLSYLKENLWLKYLVLTEMNILNYENVNQIKSIKENYSLRYVLDTLQILDIENTNNEIKEIVKEVLVWSEVSKTGNKYTREKWINSGYNLSVHNIGSAQIYESIFGKSNHNKMITILIETHGLLGQYLRGEVTLESSMKIKEILELELVNKEELTEIVYVLNKCIISAVSKNLWNELKDKIQISANKIVQGTIEEYNTFDRIKLLRQTSIINGEDSNSLALKLHNNELQHTNLKNILSQYSLWYVEAALHDFNFDEFIKIVTITSKILKNDQIEHISFENLMRNIYYDHKGKKRINIYKKRIIEKYLDNSTEKKIDIHVSIDVSKNIKDKIAFVDFKFSPTSTKLIEFCELAESADTLYEKAVITLFDMFGLRKDKFDRFYNEEEYLETMNKSINHKTVILNHLVGSDILDIGPGGGALMDMMEQHNKHLNISGIEISSNVVQTLNKKKNLEKHNWNVIQGDALELEKYVGKESIDTVVYSSIIHELYSYIEFEGKTFNKKVIEIGLQSAFNVLRTDGRIIIRDGIMTEEKDLQRIIKFRSSEGLRFLENYVRDFKGRDIDFKVTGHNEVQMSINDAMEFLYTYTWGEESYVHEVNEQFGYFTPKEYEAFIKEVLGDNANILTFNHYLQDGYSVALNTKVKLMNESREEVEYPDSTCFIVIEKKQ